MRAPFVALTTALPSSDADYKLGPDSERREGVPRGTVTKHVWPLANQEMAAALKFARYDHRFEYGTGGHSGLHGGAVLPESLRWLWRREGAASARSARSARL
ncbi:MAG: hypothetical protein HY721_34950 [Planctomycetes bacterium]|nr:hypothetical protein [Planctomycetota bacterium]